jgi:hypothetical protein
MALIGTDEPPSRSAFLFGWALPMRTDDRRYFRVIVADDALLAIGSPCESGIPQLGGECRSRIEEIASAKHAGGFIEQDGSVLITQADID